MYVHHTYGQPGQLMDSEHGQHFVCPLTTWSVSPSNARVVRDFTPGTAVVNKNIDAIPAPPEVAKTFKSFEKANKLSRLSPLAPSPRISNDAPYARQCHSCVVWPLIRRCSGSLQAWGEEYRLPQCNRDRRRHPGVVSDQRGCKNTWQDEGKPSDTACMCEREPFVPTFSDSVHSTDLTLVQTTCTCTCSV